MDKNIHEFTWKLPHRLACLANIIVGDTSVLQILGAPFTTMF